MVVAEPWQEWERERAARVGGELIPQSGAGVRKLDVGGRMLLESCKHTDAESIRIDRKMLDELDSATLGPGGIGHGVIPVLAVRIAGLGREVAIVDLESWDTVLTEDIRLIPPTKEQQRKREAETPDFLKD